MIISRDIRNIHSSVADLTNNVIKWNIFLVHDDVIKWRHFSVTGHLCREFTGHRWIPRTKTSALIFSLICTWINGWAINREAGDLRRYRTHYDVPVMYWPYVLGIHRSPVNSRCKCQWHEALMFSLICAWINGWANNREVGDLRHHRAQYDVTVMLLFFNIVIVSKSTNNHIFKYFITKIRLHRFAI